MMKDGPDKILRDPKSMTAKDTFQVLEFRKLNPEADTIVSADALLRMLILHVGGDKVPKRVKASVENGVAERAWSALLVLEQGFYAEFAAHLELRTRILAAWPGIFRWCRYFYDQRIILEKEESQETILAISSLIRTLFRDNEMRVAIRKTPGIIRLCAQLWSHPSSPFSTSVLLSLLQPVTSKDLDELVAAVGEAELVAKTALKRLRAAINTSPINLDQVSALSFTVTTLTLLSDHPLAFAFLAENAIWMVTRMLFVVSQIADSSSAVEEGKLACAHTGFTFLRRALLQQDSPKLVAQSLDAGLLRAICSFSPLLHKNIEQSWKDTVQFILRDILPKHLVYKSVVKVMKEEQEEVDSHVAESTVVHTWLREDWMSLLLLMHLRSTIANMPKAVRGRGHVACDCVACPKIARKAELLRCTGCLYVYYCSKTCQKEAWGVHRPMCKLKKHANKSAGSAGTHLLFSAQDTQFIREMVGTDASLHLPHLQKLAQRKFPDEPGENFIICLDYTNPQYPAGTCSLKNIKTYKFPPMGKSEPADPANVKAQNDEMIRMVRLNPTEWTFIEATFAYADERLTRNLMIRPNIWVQPRDPGLQLKLSSALNWQNSRCENHEDEVSLLDAFLAMNIGFADL
ncbi:hypothetical protein C8J57DRAFT_1363641 [Mycena rebaudengoi]|nr:hypothetical protein C8J57DRAFT_1363641 [Mycena rebaudengoi]